MTNPTRVSRMDWPGDSVACVKFSPVISSVTSPSAEIVVCRLVISGSVKLGMLGTGGTSASTLRKGAPVGMFTSRSKPCTLPAHSRQILMLTAW